MVAFKMPVQNSAILFSIVGHHGGLPDRSYLQGVIERWTAKQPQMQPILGVNELPATSMLAPPNWVIGNPLAYDLYIRLVFSALIDADRLDSERHGDPEKALQRERSLPSIAEIKQRFYDQAPIFSGEIDPTVRAIRENLLQACESAASQAPGLFRVTAPTGSGKTRAALAFALNHAVANDLRRIIVVSPYLTITDQTADEYRKWLGDDAVLEHHSDVARHEERVDSQNPDEVVENDTEQAAKRWRELVSENWEAPIIVTTMVQFFESLFSHQTSRARKVHNISKSVVILDEFQSMPTHLLDPSIDMLRLLIAHANVSVVLSTATQPAIQQLPAAHELGIPIELAPDPVRTFRVLTRVSYTWDDPTHVRSWTDIADQMHREHQALAIVNTRHDALALVDAMGKETKHLSTLLCPAHRRAVLKEVADSVKSGIRCHLVSTQVVEAGVNLSFPAVFRAIGPLDRIVQAAGRCNRHGEFPEGGRVTIFNPDMGEMPKGAYTTATELTKSMRKEGEMDLDDPRTIEEYFAAFYKLTSLDSPDKRDTTKQIQKLRKLWKFREVGSLYKLIADDSASVLVPYMPNGEEPSPAVALLEAVQLRRRLGIRIEKTLSEKLQMYSVSLPLREVRRMEEVGVIETLIDDSLYWCDAYDPVRGINFDVRPADGTYIV